MLKTILVTAGIVMLIAACARGRVMEVPPTSAFDAVGTILIRDETSHLVRDNTDAEIVTAMVASALKDKSYDVCYEEKDCKWDAIGKIAVLKLTKKHLAFNLQLVDTASNPIYRYNFDHGRLRGLTVEEYALKAVQYATDSIPRRRQISALPK